MGLCPNPRDLTPSGQNACGQVKLPRHSSSQVGAQVPSPDRLTLRLALNRIAGLCRDIYSAVPFVTEAIRKRCQMAVPFRHPASGGTAREKDWIRRPDSCGSATYVCDQG
jgi:hypothetical protein